MQIFTPNLSLLATLLCILQHATCGQNFMDDIPGGNTIQFSVKVKRNQTGHQVTQLRLSKASEMATNNWGGDFLHTRFESKGIEKNYIVGTITDPPQRPEDYELFPGIGYYKFNNTRVDFASAYNTCRKEGAHLVIINSNEEADALIKLLKRGSFDLVWVGIQDHKKNREFKTIFGTPINQTGYHKWKKGQPDGPSKQFCGYFDPDGLGDVECDAKEEFICEYDLSWDEW